MTAFLWNLMAFVVALGILIIIHEWGHFYVARRCGVKVFTFSIGFGKPIWSRVGRSGTRYQVAAIPLGGYVRMLDTRTDVMDNEDPTEALDQKPLWQRAAVVAAGPLVNLLFAVLALTLMYMIGNTTPKPFIGSVEKGSIVADAGLNPGDEIVSIAGQRVRDWQEVNLELMGHIGDRRLAMSAATERGFEREFVLDLSTWSFDPDSDDLFNSLGFQPYRPAITNRLALVAEGSAASQSGLQVGDKLLSIDQQPFIDWQSFVAYVADRPGEVVTLVIERDGRQLSRLVELGQRNSNGTIQGYLGVSPQQQEWPETHIFQYSRDPISAMVEGFDRTARLIGISINMIGKLLTGDVSVKSLSGPISIAQGAGTTAAYGIVPFLSFLALISVNLGVLNLLPLPMLDGGHLMFYFFEWVRGKPVPEHVQEVGYRIGGALIFMLMATAIFNDVLRVI